MGIPAEQMDQLFTKFTRLDNPRTVEAGGTGLGLFIARNWVEANGGAIWAESNERVRAALPLHPAAFPREQ